MIDEKKASKSLTIWVNVISLIAMLIQSQTGFIVGAEEQTALLTIINIILRFKTTKPIKSGGTLMRSFFVVLISMIMIISVGGITEVFANDNLDFAKELDENNGALKQSSGYIPNFKADVVFAHKTAMQGFGTQLATFKNDIIELKFGIVTALQDETLPDYTAIGIGVNISKFIEAIGGKWKAVQFNPHLGLSGLVDINGNAKPRTAFYIQVIGIQHDFFK